MVDLKDVETKVTKERVWFGFPHYVVLGWGFTLSITVATLVYAFKAHVDEELIYRNGRAELDSFAREDTNDSLAELATALAELQRQTQELRTDAARTRTIIELNFPKTAQRVEEALSGLED